MENKVTADYLDEEGCLHCGICGKRKQMKVSLMGFEHVVSCLCECEVKARQELDEKMQREEAQRQLYQRKSVGLEKGSCCVSATSEAEISREESTEKSAETGKGHGKRAGKTECRDGQYRDHEQKYQVL